MHKTVEKKWKEKKKESFTEVNKQYKSYKLKKQKQFAKEKLPQNKWNMFLIMASPKTEKTSKDVN